MKTGKPSPNAPNVQFVILNRDGKKQMLWRYCTSFTAARMMCKLLQKTYNAQRVWF